mmetsp:Transcript_22369/g.42668  ORF Transcript_22369/g.42668 Transcript_22369/m.42668 type:complete len:357 (-) Transcript_22369:447-1517(-)
MTPTGAPRVSIAPRIEVFENFATPEECAHLRDLAMNQEEFGLASLQYAGMADYHSAHLDLSLRKHDKVLACLERRVAAVTGLTALHDLDDIMVARTRPWDPSALPNHEELKTLLQQSASKEGSAESLDTERNCAEAAETVRVVDSDDSCDSEGFRLRPMVNVDDMHVNARAVLNIHHDHNNNRARSCTLMIYLSDVPEEGCGETFFPCADAPPADHIRTGFERLYLKNQLIVQHPDPGEELPGDHLDVLYECEARYHHLKAMGLDSATSGSQSIPGVVLGDDECPGVLISPQLGRAVLFYHEDVSSEIPEHGTAWHAPCRVKEGDKWLITMFKVPVGRASEAPGKVLETCIGRDMT